MIESSAYSAFFKKISGLNLLPVSYPNINFEPEESFIEVDIINSRPKTLSTCGGKTRYTWILQVNIYIRENQGAIKSIEYAEQVKANIPFNTVLSENGFNFKTINAGEIIPYFQSESGWFITPVQFRFTAIY